MRTQPPRILIVLVLAACGGDSGSTPPPDAHLDGPAGAADAAALDVAPTDTASVEAGYVLPDVPPPGCTVDNTTAAVKRRDGFVEVCADPAKNPEAVCGDGSPFKMSYRMATGMAKGLLIYFRGGGGCNDYVSCWGKDGQGGIGRRVSTMENDKNTNPVIAPQLNNRAAGFFDTFEPGNPFRLYDVVHVSYCTGDIGAGNEERVLLRPADADANAPPAIKTWFHGAANAKYAVDFMKDKWKTPSRITVLGTSAGAYASLRALPSVVEGWPDTGVSIAYLSEGGAGVGRPDLNTRYIDALKAYDGSAGKRLVRFAQMSFVSDATQRDYSLPAFQDPPAFAAALSTLIAARAAAAPTHFRSFTPAGTCHTLAQNLALYQQYVKSGMTYQPPVPPVRPNPDLTVQGMSYDAWVREVVSGDGPFPDTFPAPSAGFTTLGSDCPLPGSGL